MLSKSNTKLNSNIKNKVITEDYCSKVLNSVTLNDDRWCCVVAMVVEASMNHKDFIRSFNETTNSINVTYVYVLSYEKLLERVISLSQTESSDIQVICDYIKNMLNDDEKVLPTWLLAKLIKYMIYQAKVQNVSRIETEMNLGDAGDQESHVTQAAVRGEALDSVRSKRGMHNVEEEKFLSKVNTRLRKHREQLEDISCIGGKTDGNPDLFVVLTGFYDSHLLLELLSINVPLMIILKVTSFCERTELVKNTDYQLKKRCECNDELIHNDCDLDKSLFNFWTFLDRSLNDPIESTKFCQFIFRDLYREKETLVNNRDESVINDVYDKVMSAIFDCYKCYRQYVLYCKKMKLQNLADNRSNKYDMILYEKITSAMPEECISASVVLEALLLQVESCMLKYLERNDYTEENQDLLESSEDLELWKHGKEFTRKDNLSDSSVNNLSTVSTTFVDKLFYLNRKYGLIKGAQLDIKGNSSEMITSQDERFMQLSALITRWWSQIGDLDDGTKLKHENILHELSSCLTENNVDPLKLKHYLNLLTFKHVIRQIDFNKINCKNINFTNEQQDNDYHEMCRLFSNVFIFENDRSGKRLKDRSSLNQHFQYSMITCSMNNPDTLSADFLTNNKCQKWNSERPSLHEFNKVELLRPTEFQRRIFDCFHGFSQSEIKYSELSDCILLLFINRLETDRVIKRKQISILRTPICLRDFVEFVIDDERDWLKREETIHHDNYKTSVTNITETVKKLSSQTAIMGDNEVQKEFKLTHKNRDKRKTTTSTRKQINKSKLSTKRSSQDSNKKMGNENVHTLFLPRRKIHAIKYAANNEPYDFIGYDVGKCRVQVQHDDTTFSSIDGTRVCIAVEKWLGANKRISAHVTLDGNDVIFHYTCGSGNDDLFNFHMTTTNKIIVTFSPMHEREQVYGEFDSKYLHYMCHISWPSGLLIKPELDHSELCRCIKQNYISNCTERKKLANEVQRKYLRNGNVIIYFDDGVIKILFANGKILHINNYSTWLFQRNSFQTLQRGNSKSQISLNMNRSNESIKTNCIEHLNSLQYEKNTDSTNTTSSHTIQAFQTEKLHYNVLEADGRHYEVFDNVITKEFNRLLVRSTFDYQYGEIIMRRSDGTNMLWNSDGEFIVTFPDDTRMTTRCIVEDVPVICEWTEKEFQRYFRNKCKGKLFNDGSIVSPTDKEQFLKTQNNLKEEMKKILVVDSFVSILLTCRIEHRNYATVEYDSSKSLCTLSMPGNIKVKIMSGGCYNIETDSKAHLKVRKENIEFSKIMCHVCGGTSATTYEPQSLYAKDSIPNSKTILTTKDMYNNVFTMNRDGATKYTHAQKLCNCFDADNGNKKVCQCHATICPSFEHKNKGRYRMFSRNRDFASYEYLHQSVALQHDRDVISDSNSISICHNHLEKKHQMPRNKIIPYPSTYATSYDWLFPFSKCAKQRREFHEPLKECAKRLAKDDLRNTVLKNTATIKGDASMTLQFVSERFNEFEGNWKFERVDKETAEKRQLASDFQDLAEGHAKTINSETLVERFPEKSISNRRTSTQRTIRLNEFFAEQARRKAEIEWYRKCIREKMCVPYFDNIAGACFQWIYNCLNFAIELIETDTTTVTDSFICTRMNHMSD